MGGFDDMNFLPPGAFAVSSLATDGDEYVRCSKCGFGGCDVRVSSCGCTLHAVRRFSTRRYVLFCGGVRILLVFEGETEAFPVRMVSVLLG